MSERDDDGLGGMFVVPEGMNHPAIIAERLLLLPEHAHLKDGEAHIEWLLRADPKIQAGRQILGTCYLPSVQGQLRDFFLWLCSRMFGAVPDFLIILDQGYWEESGPREREILVYHELCHAVHATDKYGAPRFDKDTGRPVFAIKAHDVEEFSAVVRRYGAYSEEIREFIGACAEHG